MINILFDNKCPFCAEELTKGLDFLNQIAQQYECLTCGKNNNPYLVYFVYKAGYLKKVYIMMRYNKSFSIKIVEGSLTFKGHHFETSNVPSLLETVGILELFH